jgi:hypothetical protein
LNKEIYKSVFETPGFSTDISLSDEDLILFRNCIDSQFLEVISGLESSTREKLAEKGIENYHEVSSLVDHNQLWNKKNRCLPVESVSKIKATNFFVKLKNIFGEFKISDLAYDQVKVIGVEEIYWRLVRPGVPTDVGTLHADKWFHEILGFHDTIIPKNITTVKIWIPIYCEPGKNGLLMVPDSHLKKWKYSFSINNNGQPRPVFEDEAETVLINTPPGNVLIFNEGTLHGGAVNKGDKTRVSIEITLLLQ